jgi:hypothetical protein
MIMGSLLPERYQRHDHVLPARMVLSVPPATMAA